MLQTHERNIGNLAVLITCYNRKEKTLKCLRHLYEARSSYNSNLIMDVYLTDDASRDGTENEVRKNFPDVNIIKGNGRLYWSGGTRKSWKEALKKGIYQWYLLLNDDTVVNKSCFDVLFKTHEYAMQNYNTGGIYVGSVVDPATLKQTYGGRIIINKWTFECNLIIPDGTIKACHLGNANIMLVHKCVVDDIGIFSGKYTHGKSDWDYTLRASRHGFPVLVCPDFCGFCKNDNIQPDLKEMSLKERIQYLKDPKGIEIWGYMYFMWRFFPLRAPFVFLNLLIKTMIPESSDLVNKFLGRK
ncbi:MAG: glycosyltransferase family 2 protein [Clostridiaceae bacterium]|nr:glycosyltransferase family 2 protein [Clostridiaceae bacterium]